MASTDRTTINPTLSGGSITLDRARRLCWQEILRATKQRYDGVISALMGMGKSYTVPRVVGHTQIPGVVFTPRGHKEQYAQYLEWADEVGITATRIPVFRKDCPTAIGRHGDDRRKTALELRERGVRPSTIHKHPAIETPCVEGCPYRAEWAEIRDGDIDLLIGHYSHAYLEPVSRGRTNYIDEFPEGAFETTFAENPRDDEISFRAITAFLRAHDELPFGSVYDIIDGPTEAEIDATRRWLEQNGLRPSQSELIEHNTHALARVAAWGLLTATELDNGWRTAWVRHSAFGDEDDLEDYRVAVDPGAEHVHILNPPRFHGARNVIGLDGTPTMPLWKMTTWLKDKREVLTEEQKRSYITDALDHTYYVTTRHAKFYATTEQNLYKWVNVPEDRWLLDSITHRESEAPDLITTNKAEEGPYTESGVLDRVSNVGHYGDLLGSNMFKSTPVGSVIGAEHYGDGFIKKWGAYRGRSVEPARGSGPTDYGEFGNKVYRHMVESDTLQAAMRFGRDGDGATVYVHTNTLPDWVPVAGRFKVPSKGCRDVVREVMDREGDYSAAEIAAAEGVGVEERSVRGHLKDLTDHGHLDREKDGYTYRYWANGPDLGPVLLRDPRS